MAIEIRRQPKHRATGAGELAAALGRELRGEVLADAYTRHLFATDASMYARDPLLVAFPRDADDVAAAITIAGRFDVPVVARGAGTSLAGQTIGAGAIVLDTSRHMNGIGEIDAGGAAGARGSGRGAGGPQPRRAASRPGLRAGHLDRQPGHDRGHDRQQLVRQPFDRLRDDDRPRPRARGRALGRLARPAAAGRPARMGPSRRRRHARGRDLRAACRRSCATIARRSRAAIRATGASRAATGWIASPAAIRSTSHASWSARRARWLRSRRPRSGSCRCRRRSCSPSATSTRWPARSPRPTTRWSSAPRRSR